MAKTRSEIELLGPAQAAKLLGVHYWTFNNWVTNKGVKIPCVIVGKRRKYTRDGLKRWAAGDLVVGQ